MREASRADVRLLLVDALNLIRRVYAAQPGEDGAERVAGALAATVQSLRRALRESAPTHAALVFDGQGPSWRHEIYGEYKAGHAPMPVPLANALDDFERAFLEMGVESISFPGIEADDVVGTIACKARGAGAEVTVLSTDKLFLTLLPAGVRVRDHFHGRDFAPADVVDKFGVGPEQLEDFLALAGDRGNGIPGVPGIGPKTAAELLSRFPTLEEALLAVPDLEERLAQRLRDHAEEARLFRRLVGLRTDLELGINLNGLRFRPAYRTHSDS
jgi:protein Xni